MASLYLVEHKDSGTCYVGWTSKAPNRRWTEHRSYARTPKTHFHKALAKYGPEAFEWLVVQLFESDDEAKQAEIYWIERLRSFSVRLYNLTDGGDGIRGHRHSEETRAKMRGRIVSEEARRKTGAANKGRVSTFLGRTHSAEAKAKISASRKGRPSPNKGKALSEETKAKLRGRVVSQETREKLRAANVGKPNPMLGRKHSDEAKEKIRQAALRRREKNRSSSV